MKINSRTRGITWQLVMSFVTVGLFPVLIVSTISYFGASKAIKNQSIAELTAIREIKKEMVQQYFDDRLVHVSVLAGNPAVIGGLSQFQEAFGLGGVASDEWALAESEVGGFLQSYATQYGYRAAYLIGPDGRVLYSTVKEADLGTNLHNGPFQRTELADAIRDASQRFEPIISDMDFYPPAGNLPQMFLAHAVNDLEGRLAGYIALGLSPDQLEAMMGLRAGLGETGETFLVGPDMLMRTSSHLITEDSVLARKIDTVPVRRGLSGETGNMEAVDNRQQRVFAGYAPLEYGDLDWVIIAKIDQAETLAPARGLLVQQIAVAFGVVVAVTVFALWMGRRIALPIRQTAAASVRLADGDLTVEELDVKRNDEIGDMAKAFNSMVNHLRTVMVGIQQASAQLMDRSSEMAAVVDQSANATNQITSAIGQVADGATHQASSTNETVASMEQLQRAIEQIAAGAQNQAERVREMSHAMEQIADAIARVSSSAQEVSEEAAQDVAAARSGGDAVKKTVEGMSRIRSTVNDVAARVDDLGKQSQEIGEIVQIIGGIADQTNLLALNAAIEAARAGEHGRGFAVVAEEVRKLAERSAESTRKIVDLIESIQAGVKTVVDTVAGGTQEVELGVQLAGQAGEALEQLVRGITHSSQIAQEIANQAEGVAQESARVVDAAAEVAGVTEQNTAATEEMASSSAQVAEAVEQISSVSEETAAAAEEVAASTEEVTTAIDDMRTSANMLAKLAANLDEMVGRFKL